MKHRPPSVGDKGKGRAVWVVVFIVVTWALLATTVAAVTSIHGLQSSNNHHAETSAQNTALLRKDDEIRAAQKSGHNELVEIKALQTAQTMLQAELNADFNKANTALNAGQQALLAHEADVDAKLSALTSTLDAICVAVHAGCSSG